MIDAFRSRRVFPERGYAESAARAATFLLERLTRPDGGLYKLRAGKSHIFAYLETMLLHQASQLVWVCGDERF